MVGNDTDKVNKILIVDDDVKEQNMIDLFCRNLGHEVYKASNGAEGVRTAREVLPDLIIMDVMMPVMDGFDATKELKANAVTGHIPIIMLTALGEKEFLKKGISRGANDYLAKPFDLEELSLRIRNNLFIKDHFDFLKTYNVMLEQKVNDRTEALKIASEETKKSYVETIQKLNAAAEYRDEETGAHIKRISLYSRELAAALGMESEFVESIYYASPMHDIGKVGIPDGIMLKEGDLSPNEWEVMKTHTKIGAKILRGSVSPYLKMAEEIALTHHEKWNGKGYPDGLKGEDIPLTGRIVNIVDQYDALRSRRPYKGKIDHHEVVAIISKGDGRTMPDDFDPEILSVFTKVANKFDDIYNEESD